MTTDDAPRPALDAATPRAVWIIYTNWKGETERRYIQPHFIFHGTSSWHREPQWLMDAWDLERSKQRTFALSGIHGWAETSEAFDALLAAAARADALAGENDRLRAALQDIAGSLDPAKHRHGLLTRREALVYEIADEALSAAIAPQEGATDGR